MYYGRVLVCRMSSPRQRSDQEHSSSRSHVAVTVQTLIRTASSAFGMADTPPFFNSNTLLEFEQTKKPGKHSWCASDTHFIITAHHAGTLITTRLSVITSTQCWKLSTSHSTLLGSFKKHLIWPPMRLLPISTVSAQLTNTGCSTVSPARMAAALVASPRPVLAGAGLKRSFWIAA